MSAAESIAVLLADDHAETLSALAKLLRISGYTVHAAGTLAEASALAAHRSFDLLISDVQFPDGSGLDLMRDLRARYGLSGIALSGHVDKQDVKAALEAGFSRYLAKPVTFPDLLVAIEELTRDAAPAGPGPLLPGREASPVPAG